MIGTLNPYPAYKDSGVPWLGEVPTHWEVRRGKALFRCIEVRSQAGQEELLTVSSERGVVPRRSANVTMFKAESYVGYKLCWPDDLVINSLWAWARGLGVSPYHGIVSSAYGVYRLRNRQQDNPRFIHQLVRSTPFQWELQVRSKGIWVSRLQLTDDAFLGAPFPMPPSNEQTAIVRFLDYMDRRIRRAIRAKQKLIKLLDEYKQALIHCAVTGQIDVRTGQPYPAYKPPGVQWLGKVPAHWEVIPLKRLAWFKSGAGFPIVHQGETSAELPFFKVSDMNIPGNEKYLQAYANTVSLSTARSLGATVFPEGAIIFPKVGGALLTNKRRITIKPFCIDNNVMACVPTNGNHNFLFLIMSWIDLGQIAKPGPVPAISEGEVREIRVAIPPLPEQTTIVAYLDTQTAKIDGAISAARREIELLREYRERLISDVVTGKVDVREVASQLPEEPETPEEEEPESLDEEALNDESEKAEDEESPDGEA